MTSGKLTEPGSHGGEPVEQRDDVLGLAGWCELESTSGIESGRSKADVLGRPAWSFVRMMALAIPAVSFIACAQAGDGRADDKTPFV